MITAQVGATVPLILDVLRQDRPVGERLKSGVPEVISITKPDTTLIPSGQFPEWEYVRDGEWQAYWDTSALAVGEYHFSGRIPLAYNGFEGGPTLYAPFKIHVRLTQEAY